MARYYKIMNNENQSSIGTPEPQVPAPRSRKKLIIVGVALILLLILGTAVAMMLLTPQKTAAPEGKTDTPNAFSTGNAREPASYAGSEVYDACDLLSFNTVKQTIPEYAKQIDDFPAKSTSAAGSDGKNKTTAPLPISISHNYIDRTIATPLGRDGEYRSQTLSVGQGGVDAKSMESFISLFNVHCVYGQDIPVKATVASVYVTQPPTPFNPEFMTYLKTLATSQVSGMDVYQTTNKTMKYAAVVKPGNKVAVIVKTDSQEILDAAIKEVADRISTKPRGYVIYHYPAAYAKLTDPCKLLSADEFEKYTGRTASAVTRETLTLTQSKELGVDRECQRLEADRFKGDVNEIAESKVTIRQAKTADDAKAYIEERKNGSVLSKMTSSKTTLGDESYIAYRTANGVNPQLSYAFVLRSGATVIEVVVNPNAKGYASVDEFETFITPIAKNIKATYDAR